MASSEFLIRVRTQHDSNVSAFVAEHKAAMASLTASANAGLARPQLQSQVQGSQVSAEQGIAGLQQQTRAQMAKVMADAERAAGPGGLTTAMRTQLQHLAAELEAGITEAARGVRRDFARLGRVHGIETLGVSEAQAAAQRAAQVAAAVPPSQSRDSRIQAERARREADLAAERAAATAQTATTREDRVGKARETALIKSQGTREAQLLDRGLDPALAANRDEAKAAIAAHDHAETMQRRAARSAAATARLAALDADQVSASAEAAVAAGKYKGAVSRTISGQPGSVQDLGAAGASNSGLRARLQSSEIASILASEEELSVRSKAIGDRKHLGEMLNRQRVIEEQAAAAGVTSLRNQQRQVASYAASTARESDRRTDTAVKQAERSIERALNTQARDAEKTARFRAREVAASEKAVRLAELHAEQGTIFQRLEQRVARRSGRDDRPAVQFPTLGQAATSGFITTARFAVSGALLYGALNTVQQMVRDSSELEKVFAQIQRQFESTDRAGQFPGFRKAMVALARETGQSLTQVAFVGFQMQGAFQDAEVAVQQTTSAIKIARVTGLELGEVVDSLTAISIAYRDIETRNPLPIADIGDITLGLQERFGVLAKETIKATADLAPVAKAAGIPYRELATIIASIQQVSGRSGTAIAEGLGRVLPAIQESTAALVGLYSATPALGNRVTESGKTALEEVAGAAGTGQTGVILERLIRDYDRLDQTQKNFVVSLLGGRREAQLLNGLFGNSSRLIGELDRAYTDGGKTQQYFADLQKTLTQQLAQTGQVVADLGQQLFRAGLGDFLKDLVTAGGAVLSVLALVAKVLSEINDVTGGSAAKILELVVALRLLRALGGIGVVQSILGGAAAVGVGGSGVTAYPYGRGSVAQRAGAFVDNRVALGRTAAAAGGTALARGALGGLGALGIDPVALAAVTSAVAVQQYFAQQTKLREAAGTVTTRLAQLDADNIKRVREEGRLAVDFWTKLAVRLPGGPSQTPDEISVDVERGKRNAPNIKAYEAAIAAKLLDNDSHNQKVIADARAGLEGANNEVNNVVALFNETPQGRAEMEKALAEFAKQQAGTTAAQRVDSGDAQASVDAAKAAYEAGNISGAAYLARLDQELSGFRDIIRVAGHLTADQAEKYTKLQRDQSQFISSQAYALAAQYEVGIDVLGGETESVSKVERLTGLLRNPAVTDPKVRAQAARDLVAAQNQVAADMAALADSEAEKLAAMQAGTPLIDEARIAILQEALLNSSTAFGAVMDSVATMFGGAADFAYLVAAGAIANGISTIAALRDLLVGRINAITSQFGEAIGEGDSDVRAERNKLQDALDKLNSYAGSGGVGPSVPGGTTRPDAQALHQQEKAAQNEAEAAARKAEAEAKEARRQQQATSKARLNLRKAQLEGDPVGQAQAAIEEAHLLASFAETEAESLDAQAQLVSAQNQLARAQLSVSDAYRNINRAMAAAAGDTVRVAQIELEQAREHLASAHARGDILGGLEAEAAVIAAQAGAVQAQLDQGQQQTDFLLQMEKITTAQAIAALEGMLRIPGITQEQTQQLLLKIHNLRKEMSRDVQFDIPGEIKLPTLYEARRANQLATAGGAYQDNRQIGVQYIVMTPQDHQQALNDLVSVVGGNARVGTQPRTYP